MYTYILLSLPFSISDFNQPSLCIAIVEKRNPALFLGAKGRVGPKRMVVVVVVVGSPITSGSKEIERTDKKKKERKNAAERRKSLTIRKTIYVFAMESTSNTQ